NSTFITVIVSCLNCHLFVPLTQYSVPVIKYDRNGFRPRFRQLVLTQKAAYLVEEAKIKQRVEYSSLKGVSVSNLSDNFLIFHVTCEDIKQKVRELLDVLLYNKTFDILYFLLSSNCKNIASSKNILSIEQ
uniref:TH1 domain-containing protein n=1 Tax=Astyanax mexicanus TaxID=7994 RepID=A0A3B1ICT3_ASTMX